MTRNSQLVTRASATLLVGALSVASAACDDEVAAPGKPQSDASTQAELVGLDAAVDGGIDAAVDAPVEAAVQSCLGAAPAPADCPPGCWEQKGVVLTDAGACGMTIRMYCGVPLPVSSADVKCRVRLSDGTLVLVPQLLTEEPPALYRECTADERTTASNTLPNYCK